MPKANPKQSSYVSPRLLLVLSIVFLSAAALFAAPVPPNKPSNYPAWWFSRSVIALLNATNNAPMWTNSYPSSDDYAVINEGQLKNVATQAYNELYAQSPTNVWNTPQGANLTTMVNGWSTPGSNENDYQAVNLGQVKTVAIPFYNVLMMIGYSSSYPWTGYNADDYSVANIGQVKNAFSFDVGLDSDSDGLPDWWELKYFGHLGNNPYSSPDGNGLSLAQDYQQGNDPTNYYSQNGATITPMLTIFSGNNLTSAPYNFMPQPLVVEVTNSSGVVLVNAPVTFTVTSGGGSVAASSVDPTHTTTSLLVTTNSLGLAQVYYLQPAANTTPYQISATSGGQSVSFTETSLAPGVPPTGLSLWLKTDDTSGDFTTNAGGVVSAWLDHSPNGNNAAIGSSSDPVTVISQGTGGKPMVHFDGGTYLVVPDAASLRPNYITVLAVAQENSTSTYQTLISRGYRSTGGWNTPYVSWDDCLFGINLANYLRSAVTTGGNLTENNVGNTYDISQAHVFAWKYDGTAQRVYLSGAQTGSTPTTNAVDYSGGAANICIGARSDAYPGEYLNAGVSEILVYDHASSTNDQNEAEGYLADKYGLYDPNATWCNSTPYFAIRAAIIRNQWSRKMADSYLAFQAANPTMLTNGLLLWFKADGLQADGMTSSVAHDSSNNVTSWTDQTGNYTVSASGSTEPTYVASDLNGKPGLHFSGSQWLTNSSALMGPGLNSDMTIITVGMTSSYPTGSNPWEWALYLGANVPNVYGLNRSFLYDGGQEYFDGQYVGAMGGHGPSVNTFVAEAASLNSTLNQVTFYQNGTQTMVSNLAIDSKGPFQNLSAGITIGGVPNGNNTWYPWQGDIVEQLVYDHQLSSAEVQQVSVYLAQKYNLLGPSFLAPTLPPPSISPAAGSYSGTLNVTIAGVLLGTSVNYTIDGSTPAASSPTYTGPIALTGSALVQAALFYNGVMVSPITSVQYYVNDTGHTGLSAAPTSLAVTSNSTGSAVNLSWQLSSFVNYEGVYVYRSVNGGAYQLIGTLAANATSYTDTDVISGQAYSYEVGTVNASGINNTSPSSVTPTAPAALTIYVTTPSNATNLP